MVDEYNQQIATAAVTSAQGIFADKQAIILEAQRSLIMPDTLESAMQEVGARSATTIAAAMQPQLQAVDAFIDSLKERGDKVSQLMLSILGPSQGAVQGAITPEGGAPAAAAAAPPLPDIDPLAEAVARKSTGGCYAV